MEFHFKLLSGCDAGVLQPSVYVVIEHVHIGQNFAQVALPAVSFGVLFPRKPTEEISGSVIEFVGDKVVDDAGIRAPFPSFPLKGQGVRWPRAIESERHEDVTVNAPYMRIASVHVRLVM